MSIGKYVYFIPSIAEKPTRGKITAVSVNCGLTVITIKTKDGREYTGTENQFTAGRPAICNYWRC